MITIEKRQGRPRPPLVTSTTTHPSLLYPSPTPYTQLISLSITLSPTICSSLYPLLLSIMCLLLHPLLSYPYCNHPYIGVIVVIPSNTTFFLCTLLIYTFAHVYTRIYICIHLYHTHPFLPIHPPVPHPLVPYPPTLQGMRSITRRPYRVKASYDSILAMASSTHKSRLLDSSSTNST